MSTPKHLAIASGIAFIIFFTAFFLPLWYFSIAPFVKANQDYNKTTQVLLFLDTSVNKTCSFGPYHCVNQIIKPLLECEDWNQFTSFPTLCQTSDSFCQDHPCISCPRFELAYMQCSTTVQLYFVGLSTPVSFSCTQYPACIQVFQIGQYYDIWQDLTTLEWTVNKPDYWDNWMYTNTGSGLFCTLSILCPNLLFICIVSSVIHCCNRPHKSSELIPFASTSYNLYN